MKKIVSTCVLLIFCYITKAQNNLQFNRVLLLRADSISTCSSNCPDTILFRSFTVAPDKVLKIESINYNPGNYVLFLDGSSFPRITTQIPTTFPIWLPSGTYSIYFGTFNTANSASGQYSYLLSALEFNVVQ
ncbi:MAG: hypothetical protein V4685_12580 [Bacteroidota bacterium]